MWCWLGLTTLGALGGALLGFIAGASIADESAGEAAVFLAGCGAAVGVVLGLGLAFWCC